MSSENLPEVVSREEWLAARTQLLAREKELTAARDTLSADRRRMPMTRVDKDYRFTGPDGEVGLLDLFGDRRQLLLQHMMFDPAWDDPCTSCTAMADTMSERIRAQLDRRDTAYAAVSRAPFPKLASWGKSHGWTFPWYSSFGSDFNYDFHVTLDERVTPVEYNFRSAAEFAARGEPFDFGDSRSVERPGRSAFLRIDDRVFHTYSVYARGLESMGGSYYLLDETALGRQEDWEQPEGRADDVRTATPDFAR